MAEKPVTRTPGAAVPQGRGGAPSLFDLRREVDDLFDNFFRGFPSFGRAAPPVLRGFDFEVDVAESDKAIEVKAELPGMEEKDIDVELSDDVLTIRGEKKEEREEKDRNWHLSERRYGSFLRSFRLPEGIEPDKVKAVFDKGVLHVTVPKNAKAQPKARKIAVGKK